MDEIEFRAAYNTTNDAVNEVADVATKKALYLILQLLNALQEQITEMQLEDDC